MFALDESDVTAILAAFDRDGEAAAAVELRRRFPGLSQNAAARMIVRWGPVPGSAVLDTPPSRRP